MLRIVVTVLLLAAWLFLLEVGSWAVLPNVLDGVILWGVLVAGWTQTTLATA